MEMSKKYPYLTVEMVKLYDKMYASSYKTARGYENFLNKKNKEMKDKVSAPKVIHLTITIRWYKNRYGEKQAVASAIWKTEEGKIFSKEKMARSSGSGTDKGSYVLLECVNQVLSGTMAKKALNGEVLAEDYPSVQPTSFMKMLMDYGIKLEKKLCEPNLDMYVLEID